MVRAYVRSGELARQLNFPEDKRRRFMSTRDTLFHFMTPTERHLARTIDAELNKPKEQSA